jgi:hypothetical protein
MIQGVSIQSWRCPWLMVALVRLIGHGLFLAVVFFYGLRGGPNEPPALGHKFPSRRSFASQALPQFPARVMIRSIPARWGYDRGR